MEPVDLVGEGFVITFLKGNNDKFSMMRLLSLLCVAGTLPLCYIYPEQSIQWATIIGFGMAFKWAQRRSE